MHSSALRRYQKMLLEKRQEVLSANTDLRSQLPPAGVTEGDLVDQANAEFEAELQVRLHQTDAKLLRAIDEALIRIRRGTYGVCTSCERPISAARLRAVPWTHHCITCKEREQR